MTLSISDLNQYRKALLRDAADAPAGDFPCAALASIDARLRATRVYDCDPSRSGDYTVYERTSHSGNGWQVVSGDSLDQLEARLEAALQAVRAARSSGAPASVEYVPA